MNTTSPIQDRLKPDSVIQNEYGGYQRYSPRFVLAYWSTRCLGASIRMLLSAAQINHWVVFYDAKEAEGDDCWDKSSWLHDKEWLQKEYPLINLPFLVDTSNGVVLSQTNAILSYLGRELKLLGRAVPETCQCEELLCEIADLRDLMINFAYYGSKDKATMKQDALRLLEESKRYFERLEHHLEKQYPLVRKNVVERDELDTYGFRLRGGSHLVGRKFTAPDFALWDILDQFQGLCKHFDIESCLGTSTTCSDQVDKIKTWETATDKVCVYPFLREFWENFINLPANEVYGTQYKLNFVVDDRAVRLPYNSPYARFGSEPESLGSFTRGQAAPWRALGVRRRVYTRIDTGIEYWDDEAIQQSRRAQR